MHLHHACMHADGCNGWLHCVHTGRAHMPTTSVSRSVASAWHQATGGTAVVPGLFVRTLAHARMHPHARGHTAHTLTSYRCCSSSKLNLREPSPSPAAVANRPLNRDRSLKPAAAIGGGAVASGGAGGRSSSSAKCWRKLIGCQ